MILYHHNLQYSIITYTGNLSFYGLHFVFFPLECLIAVVSLVLTAFGLGYAIGSNHKAQK
jgi:hypothetical protein